MPHPGTAALGLGGGFELLHIGPMILQGFRDLPLFQRDLSQQVVGGAQLKAQLGVGGHSRDQRIEQRTSAVGIAQSARDIAPAPHNPAVRQRGVGGVAPKPGVAAVGPEQ